MRRPLVRGRRFAASELAAGRRILAQAQKLEFATHARELLRQLEHRLVLFGHVPLEVGDFLFETSNAFLQTADEFSAAAGRPSSGRARE